MKVFSGEKLVAARPRFVALGNFDGLHLGHKRILRHCLHLARQEEGSAGIFTFRPHPRSVVQAGESPPLLKSRPQKHSILEQWGLDWIQEWPFDSLFAQMEASHFIKTILVPTVSPALVAVGADFCFGRNREGTPELLKALGATFGFKTEIFPKLRLNKEEISSTRVRQCVMRGDMVMVHRLLGRPYFLDGQVIHGAARGRTLGTPTANLAVGEGLLPADGVYALAVTFPPDRIPFKAVANLGVRPTFGGSGRSLEVHLLTGREDFYGQHMRVWFLKRLREERHFSSVESLQEAIAKDIQTTEHYFSEHMIEGPLPL